MGEIIDSIRQNPVRNISASLGVSWGIFVLIVLLGIGRGFESGVFHQLRPFTLNTLWFHIIGQDKNGHPNPGFHFDSTLMSRVQKRYPQIQSSTPESLPTVVEVMYNEYRGRHLAKGVSSGFFQMKSLTLQEGRALSYRDDRALVVVLGKSLRQSIFGRSAAIGKYLHVNDTYYRVIGVLNDQTIAEQQETNSILISYNSLTTHLAPGDRLMKMGLGLRKGQDPGRLVVNVKKFLLRSTGMSADDQDSIYFFSSHQQAEGIEQLFRILRYFIWAIGLSIMAGSIIAIGNTAYLSVNQRMDEIAIRKAVGATPMTIARLIVGETLVVVMVAGGIGIGLGLLINQVLSWSLLILSADAYYHFAQLTVAPTTIALAFFILCFSGVSAGMIPASRAMRVKPAQILIRR